jgi:uncharacterized protein
MPISNKNIVITGAASGIGKELALQLATNNKILAVDINQAGLELLKDISSHIEILTLDLTTKGSVSEIFKWVDSRWQTVDLFFANAGFAHFGSWEQTDLTTYAKMLQINVLSPIETAKFLKRMQIHHPCRLVVTASAMSYWPVPGYAAYASTKAGLHQFVETMRSEGDGDWITMIYPAATDTDFFNKAGKKIPKAYPVQSVHAVVRRIIIGVAKGQKRIYPSRLFQATMLANRYLPIFKPFYFYLERRKLKHWLTKQAS